MIRSNYLKFNGVLVALLLSATTMHGQVSNDSAQHHSSLDRTHRLKEVVVRGNIIQRVNGSAYNAVAIDTRRLRNTTLNLADVLNRISGVKVRSDGGLGSGNSIHINGFSGKQLRIFIDGIPMDESSTSFSLNNIPVTLANSVAVYKGVVPVSLGSDALGGAVNIVTDHSPHTYIDASYSYGSFNTHRSNLSLGWTGDKGWTVRLIAYQNYSDNDYKVKTQWTNLATNALSNDERWFRRFHDRYHNEAVIAQAGIVNQPWADKLIFGFTYSHEYAQIQNANLMKIVFGKKYRTSHTLSPSVMYEKRNLLPRLNFRWSARMDFVTTNNVDTASRTYTWTGEYKLKDYQGEGIATLAEFTGRTFSNVVNLTYNLAPGHTFALNDTYSRYSRHTTNNAANSVQSSEATFMRRVNGKNTLGLSYQWAPVSTWNATAFIKYFSSHVRGPVNTASSGRAVYEEQQRSRQALGWGAVATWLLFNNDLQLKLSYERTSRLPTDLELFGDGDYEQGNTTLKPERSDNINLNLGWQHNWDERHTVGVEVTPYFRYIRDYIIRTIAQNGSAMSDNHGKVRGLGADVAIRYAYKDIFSINANYALQNFRDDERLNLIGAKSVTYGNRVPNQPYAFGGAYAQLLFKHLASKSDRLTLSYHLNYVHRFYRSWSGEGAKLYIPEQISHDAAITYTFGGRYNIAFEANNIGNALLYDNYSLQKPGRSFSLKFRYVFYKR
ncbi:MAG: TonB-dependent receptor domain-containing protein [Prevotella sp.]|jgi:outer membrane receptor protein involved in Fe transport